MYANYHTHTPLCHHAFGTPEEYIEEGIRNGLRILGFSDHVPQIFENGYVSKIRMTPEEARGYVRELSALRERYRDKIELLIGYEAEYYPATWNATLSHIRECGCDFLILGQHFTGNEYDGLYVAKTDCDDGLLLQYADQSIAALRTGAFSAFAHPDVVRYTGDDDTYRREMTRLCRVAKEMDVPLELNLHGLHFQRHYPADRFWRIAAEVGNTCIIGNDAHETVYVGNPELYEQGLLYLRGFGLEPLKQLELKKL